MAHHLVGTDDGEDDNLDEETAVKWGVIDRLPTRKRLRSALFDDDHNQLNGNNGNSNKRLIDVTKLGALERHVFMEKLIQRVEHDNLHLLQKIRKRIEKVGIELPSIEVRYENLHIETECEVVRGRALPTLWNSVKSVFLDIARIPGFNSRLSKISIINGVSGIIKPGRMTLLLGPPGCGKTTLLKALSGNLSKSLEVSGDITYNGYKLTEFVPQKTSAYISQYDLHIGEMTVRETLDFSLRCQGVGSRAEIMKELIRREKEAGIHPDLDIDTYMKATSVEGQKTTLQTDYILRILGLDICADTLVGDVMSRGISGGEKRRLTTGEMIVGPTRALFMDEISNGLDSATTFQIVAFLQQLAHITDATILVSLLQPAPETFDLFDDVILMGEGKVVYHGPRSQALDFFESCGFRCPARKGIPDFLQEVLSRKDQAQYWRANEDSYRYISIDAFLRKHRESFIGKKISDELSSPFPKSKSHKDAITFTAYSFSKWELLKTCSSREFLIMKGIRLLMFLNQSRSIAFNALVVMTLFLRTMMKVDLLHANYYMGALFYAVAVLVINAFPEVPLTIARLPVFYKHRDLSFYPAWVYVVPSAILKIPHSLLEAAVFTCLTYYVVGYTPEAGRFFGQLVILFLVHLAAASMYRLIASLSRNVIVGTVVGSLSLLYTFLFSGFLIPRTSIPNWLKWGFWVCPNTYGEIAINVNEFLAPRWKKMLPSNITIGREILSVRGLNFDEDLFWISFGALLGFTLLFNIGWTLALSFLHYTRSRPIISWEKYSQLNNSFEPNELKQAEKQSRSSSICVVPGSPEAGSMVLPFEPLTVVFHNLQYYVDTPLAMKDHGFAQKKLQLLQDITGTFRPGVLTALMGVSGAGKTTLFDVIAGRKTGGALEGEIRVGGFLKVQKTFARVSGYCEQTDIHSPQITVEESIMFSAWLRLNPDIDSKTRADFVKEVLETIELDGIKDALVGIPGVTGLSGEQRKRLTIAVELVANPSILFLDEPTTGLDARAAAIVMRAVKNIATTGRTIVCTIHQPSIDIFEAFDELLLLKSGGRMIYCGPLGLHSNDIINYFEGISGVPKIQNNRNPATWMLEVTSISSEAALGVDFADIFKKSSLYESNKELVKRLSSPAASAKPLEFPTQFAHTRWGQFKACLWKQHWSYWRSPSHNLMRLVYLIITSLALGVVFWKQGKKIENQQNLLNVLGSLFCPTIFIGFINATAVMRYVSTERSVVYRERFAGLYASWVYALAQVTIEIPYILFQVVVLTVITYPMIGYYGSAYKIFWYVYSMICSLLYCTYLGMLLIAVTPSYPLGVILLSTCYSVFNLLSGLFIPQPQIPKWWIWLYYLNPTSWTMKGMFISQYGDIEQPIMVFGKNSTVRGFLGEYFEFHHHQLPVVAVVLLLYPIVFACLFLFFISKLNFEKR